MARRHEIPEPDQRGLYPVEPAAHQRILWQMTACLSEAALLERMTDLPPFMQVLVGEAYLEEAGLAAL